MTWRKDQMVAVKVGVGPKIMLRSGAWFDFCAPASSDFTIEDIAHGLARVARWNGQTKGAYAFSVAQHSLLVEQIASHFEPDLDRPARLAALLHDAPEYVIGDMISPFKAALGVDYKDFEHTLLSAIHIRFGLPARPPPALTRKIKAADRIAAYLEATQLAGFSVAEASKLFGAPRGLEGTKTFFHLRPLTPNDAANAYIKKFKQLS